MMNGQEGMVLPAENLFNTKLNPQLHKLDPTPEMSLFDNVKYVYLLGIGGIGMSALARYFRAAGKMAAGYDKTPTPLTDALITEGIAVNFNDSPENIPPDFISAGKEELLIIYTPAIPKDNRQLTYFQEHDYDIHKRSAILGKITAGSFTVAIAGTHGKTTTSAIITHLLKNSGINCTAFLGGISVNYDTNFIQGDPGKDDHVVVVEADEFDRSFLTLHPDIAIITSMDADHLDIYEDKRHLEESYRLFAGQVKKEGTLIVKKGLDIGIESALTYSITGQAGIYAEHIRVERYQYIFDVHAAKGTLEGCRLGMPGRHNVENAVAAIAVSLQLGMNEKNIMNALAGFKGVKRRFEYHIQKDDCIFIDDYAHHPEELKAVITSVKELYHDRKVTGVFQPHLFTRTRDFASEFAASLSLLDAVLMLDIYPARELPIEGITSQLILDKIKTSDKMLCSKKQMLEEVARRRPEVLITMGAGDIDQLVEPIKELLL